MSKQIQPAGSESPRPSDRLAADCERCAGLCCVAPTFSRSADFAIDKKAGQACPHLNADFRCGIHDRLRAEGFPGCSTYDCFGAGQQVTLVTFGGQDWRRTPGIAKSIFEAFRIMRHLHELLWHLAEAVTFPEARPLSCELQSAIDEIQACTRCDAAELLQIDVLGRRRAVNALLLRASEMARGADSAKAADYRGADLIGKDLRGADLRRSVLVGAYLIGTKLAGADLRGADLRAADLRGADVRGAILADCLFLTQSQVETAVGDRHTKLPTTRRRPQHWNLSDG